MRFGLSQSMAAATSLRSSLGTRFTLGRKFGKNSPYRGATTSPQCALGRLPPKTTHAPIFREKSTPTRIILPSYWSSIIPFSSRAERARNLGFAGENAFHTKSGCCAESAVIPVESSGVLDRTSCTCASGRAGSETRRGLSGRDMSCAADGDAGVNLTVPSASHFGLFIGLFT